MSAEGRAWKESKASRKIPSSKWPILTLSLGMLSTVVGRVVRLAPGCQPWDGPSRSFQSLNERYSARFIFQEFAMSLRALKG